MRRKDKLIKEAFGVYQRANAGEKNTDSDSLFEIDGGFEEKIYCCIKRMHIANPRVKARRIKFGILMAVVLCIVAGFLTYYQLHKPVAITQKLNSLYQEAYNWHCNCDENYTPSRVFGADGNLGYDAVMLNAELAERFDALEISYSKTEQTMFSQNSDSKAGEKDTFCGTGADAALWNVYRLSDRESSYYYILKDNAGQMALAKFAGVCTFYGGNSDRAGTDTICREVYSIESAKDVRSITLTRVQEKGKDEPEKLMAVYTRKQEKENIISILLQRNVIRDIQEGSEVEAGGEEKHRRNQQSIEALYGKDWKEAIEVMGEKCYILSIENRYHENFCLGVAVEGEAVQVFTGIFAQKELSSTTLADGEAFIYRDTRCVELSEEQQKQIQGWIAAAE